MADKLTITGDVPIVVSDDLPKPIGKALADLRDDWYRVFGLRPLVKSTPFSHDGPTIRIARREDLDVEEVTPPADQESFLLAVTESNEAPTLVVSGADIRGTIYAIYALSEQLLGVDPLYHWTGNEPDTRQAIDVPIDYRYDAGPPTYRRRGWFVNDEDYLHFQRTDPLEENVFSIDAWDRIYETLLRTRGNMIVPGTFTRPDETCRELARDRGLLINDHHICPLGLVTFEWPDDIPYSWHTNSEELLEAWETTVAAQQDYDMVWTVSFRGKNDHAFWADVEGAPETDKERAAYIQEVIEAQVELIQEYDTDPDIVCTMFNELTEFYREGRIEFPDCVVPVWDDDNAGMINDAGTVQSGEGVYYHVAHGLTNRATEAVPPQRIFSELGRFAEAGATEFFLLNVANIKQYGLSLSAAMDFVWNSEQFSSEPDIVGSNYAIRWASEQFGQAVGPEVGTLVLDFLDCANFERRDVETYPDLIFWRGYEDIEPILPDWLVLRFLRRLCREIRRQLPNVEYDPERLPVNEGTYVMFDDHATDSDPEAATLAALDDLEALFENNDVDLSALSRDGQELRAQIPADRRDYYDSQVLGQVDYLKYGNEALRELSGAYRDVTAGNRDAAVAGARRALDALEAALAVRHRTHSGQWDTWPAGDMKSDPWHTRDHLRCLLAALRGNDEPPVRSFQGGDFWSNMVAYHERGSDNYPLFYDSPRWSE